MIFAENAVMPGTNFLANDPPTGKTDRKLTLRDSVVRVLQSERELTRAASIKCSLLDIICGRTSNVAMVGLAFAVCGLASLIRDGLGSTPFVALVGVGFVCLRCLFILHVRRTSRLDLMTSPDHALVPFGLTAIGSAICWGIMSFVAMTASGDHVLAMIILMSCIGTAGSVAARNAAVPRLAKIMLVASLTPIMVASLLAQDKGFLILVILVPAFLVGLFVLIDESNQQLVDLFEMQITQSRLSNTDPLTNLSNRRLFDELIADAVAQAARRARPLAILMIDVDHFKDFNDRHGHPAGDACLQSTADVLRLNLRDGDLAFRYGGEEFAVILHDVAGKEADEIAKRLCEAVAGLESQAASRHVVTISVGVASTDHVALDATALLAAADAALYQAKNEGRNRIARFAGGDPKDAFSRAA